MSEEEIRLDQTKKVFDTLADLISKNETCSYRYLIYDLLGFEHGDYGELMSGMSITNKLVECETQKEVIDKIKEEIKKYKYTDSWGDTVVLAKYIEDLLEEIE